MVEIEGDQSSSSLLKSPQQISDVFQKFADAFRAKTYELFADDSAAGSDCGDVALLLDSTEEIIPDQKVVVIKPDAVANSSGGVIRALIPSLFATVSSLEASYLQFQAAHVPRLDQTALEQADGSIVSILHKLNEMRSLYKDYSKNRGFGSNCGSDFDFPASSFLEFQVQENQSKLRVLETIVNTLQSQIDAKDDEVRNLREKLDHIRDSNPDLAGKLGPKEGNPSNPRTQAFLTIRVFEAMLGDAVKSVRCFTKLLIDLMKKAGWNLEQVPDYIHSGVNYAKPGHYRYAYLSYVSMGMFHNFEKNDFGLCDGETICNGDVCKHDKTGAIEGETNGYWQQLVEHISSNPMEILRKNPNCDFSRFCQKKYAGLIHPTMESSIFSNLDWKDKVLDSWKSLTGFFDSFVRMASSIWLLHKLAYSFNPAIEIFQVERGTEFSMVYVDDVSGKRSFRGKTKPRIGFTVVPGFKIGRTVIQSQVYLTDRNQTEAAKEMNHKGDKPLCK